MKKYKDIDTFSFDNEYTPIHDFKDRKQLMANYQYRIDALNKQTIKEQYIPKKILDLDKIIQQNAKRKHQIEQQLKLRKQQLVEQNHLKNLIQNNMTYMQAKQFSKVQQQKHIPSSSILNKQKSSKPYIPTNIQLNITDLALMEKQLSFPQYPSINKQKLIKFKQKLQKLNIIHQHADVVYLLIICYYHLNSFQQVIEQINNLIMFKRFNPKGFWIAAQAAYNIQNHQKCKQLAQLAISQIKDHAKILPRLIYLKAKSNMEMSNHLEAIVSYNQLIILQPNVPEYYLERSLLFERANYNDYAQQDFKKYRQLKPSWKGNLKQRILTQKSANKKQYYQALLRSLEDY